VVDAGSCLVATTRVCGGGSQAPHTRSLGRVFRSKQVQSYGRGVTRRSNSEVRAGQTSRRWACQISSAVAGCAVTTTNVAPLVGSSALLLHRLAELCRVLGLIGIVSCGRTSATRTLNGRLTMITFSGSSRSFVAFGGSPQEQRFGRRPRPAWSSIDFGETFADQELRPLPAGPDRADEGGRCLRLAQRCRRAPALAQTCATFL
jgi:hypothetical protein